MKERKVWAFLKCIRQSTPLQHSYTTTENTRPRASLLGVPENAQFVYMTKAHGCTAVHQALKSTLKLLFFTRIIYSALKITSPLSPMSTFKRKNNTSALASFFHHYHLNQHICCHEGPIRICKRARSREFPKLVYHGMFDYSVVPFALCSPPSIPLPHPEVAFVLVHTPPLHSSHTLSPSWTILFPSSMP